MDQASLAHLTPAERAALDAFVRAAREQAGSRLLGLKLFGSRQERDPTGEEYS